MRSILLFPLLLLSNLIVADDSEFNPVAKKIKSKLQKQVDKRFDDYQGYCDVMIELEHSNSTAKIRRVTGIGDTRICKFAKSKLKKGKKFKYRYPEKFIRLHLSTLSKL
ncbi:hypothetical protein ACPV5J_21235 [Vibrio rotiferianus]|uniref:hypothetical protein n=1 Tax=Vibrio rotiferianus TaxID=190895 RepID=UPI00406A899E